MAKEMTTQVWFGNVKFSFGADDEDGLMEFSVCHEDEPEDYEGRHWYAPLTPEEMEYLAHRMLDAVEYQRRQEGKEGELTMDEPSVIVNTLLQYQGDRKKAALALAISERTLYRKINQYNIDKIYHL